MAFFDDLPAELRNYIFELRAQASPSGFVRLPPELRNQIYEFVAHADPIRLSSQPLRDPLRRGFTFSSRRLLSFASRRTQREYHDIVFDTMNNIRGGTLVVNVADFNFTSLTRYLTDQIRAANIKRFLDGGNIADNAVIYISLKLTKGFDGTSERAFKWERFAQKILREHGATLNTQYYVARWDETPALLNFMSSLPVEGDLDQASQWAEIVRVYRRRAVLQQAPDEGEEDDADDDRSVSEHSDLDMEARHAMATGTVPEEWSESEVDYGGYDSDDDSDRAGDEGDEAASEEDKDSEAYTDTEDESEARPVYGNRAVPFGGTRRSNVVRTAYDLMSDDEEGEADADEDESLPGAPEVWNGEVTLQEAEDLEHCGGDRWAKELMGGEL